MTATAAPGIVTGAPPPNAVVQIQPGMNVQPVVLVDQTGNYITSSGGTAIALATTTNAVNVSSATAPTATQVLTAVSGTVATWQALPTGGTATAGVLQLDGTATDIQPAGVQAAGASGKATDAGHVHPWVSSEPLTSGEALFLRATFTGVQSLTGSVLALTYWTACKTETINHVKTITGGTNASGLTYANIGIFTIDGSGNLTLAASTGDLHASLWTSTYTTYTSSLTSGFSKVAGTRYAMGLLAVGTTPPNLYAQNVSFGSIAPIIAATASETTMPSSLSAGSLSISVFGTAFQAVITP